jgi:hypothetical protein
MTLRQRVDELVPARALAPRPPFVHVPATIRCLPLDGEPVTAAGCVCCGRPAVAGAVWAQSY